MEFKLCANPSDIPEQLVCLKWNPWECCKAEISLEWGIYFGFLVELGKTPPALVSKQKIWNEQPGTFIFQTLASHADCKDTLDSRQMVELRNKGEWKTEEKNQPYKLLVIQCQLCILPSRLCPRGTQKLFPVPCTWAGSNLALVLWTSLRADSVIVTGKLQFQNQEMLGTETTYINYSVIVIGLLEIKREGAGIKFHAEEPFFFLWSLVQSGFNFIWNGHLCIRGIVLKKPTHRN